MAFTVGQSHDVNVLCDYLLEGHARMESMQGRQITTREDAIKALARLADHSNKALMAGWSGDRVLKAAAELDGEGKETKPKKKKAS